MRIKSLVVLLFLLSVALPTTSWTEPLQRDQGPPLGQKKPTPEEENRAKLEKEMAKKRNEERQQQLKRDTEKLLKLSTELKEYVDNTNENLLSLEVVKKAEEIEKLARSVKDKMKGN